VSSENPIRHVRSPGHCSLNSSDSPPYRMIRQNDDGLKESPGLFGVTEQRNDLGSLLDLTSFSFLEFSAGSSPAARLPVKKKGNGSLSDEWPNSTSVVRRAPGRSWNRRRSVSSR